MMKKLLPLALIAVACEAMAQDAQCVRQRAAMVENIQAYARSDLSLMGPQGISESVLEAVRQTERHRFVQKKGGKLRVPGDVHHVRAVVVHRMIWYMGRGGRERHPPNPGKR